MKEEQQEQFDRFVDEIISCGKKENGEPLKIHFYEEAQPWLVELLKKAGLDIEGFNHSLTDENIIHNLKNHSNPALERKSGNIAITSEDLKYIPQIINEPDIVYAGLKRYKQNPDHIAYLKYNNNATDIFIERIFPGSKELRSATRYKKPKHITKEKFIKILGMNEKTDVSNAVYIEKKEINRQALAAPEASRSSSTSKKSPVAATSTTPPSCSINNIGYLLPNVNRKDKFFHIKYPMSRN